MTTISDTRVAGFVEQFRKSEKLFSPQLSELRKKAIADLESTGFPAIKNEEWKYTNVNNILKNSFSPASTEPGLSDKDIQSFIPASLNAILLVFENGIFNKNLSKIDSLQKGLIIGSLNDYSDHPAVKKHLAQLAPQKEEGFVALNTALFHEGAFIFADKNVIGERPVYLLFVNNAQQSPTVSYPRNLIVASPGSFLKIAESYHSVKAVNSSFCNSVTEIFVDEDANIEFCKNEAENENDFHVDYTNVVLKKNSRLNIHTITSGGKLVRNNLKIELKERNASAYLNGLFVTSGDSHVDNHSFVDHASPDCYSNELYKGVLGGKSMGVFNGKIFVRRDAQKTNAYQSNKNIILSDDASMNAKPQLEIYADDVKCSHGATTGQLDDEALFYLRTRGIGVNEARAFLTTAFAEEILDKITVVSLKEMLKEVIHSKLRKDND